MPRVLDSVIKSVKFLENSAHRQHDISYRACGTFEAVETASSMKTRSMGQVRKEQQEFINAVVWILRTGVFVAGVIMVYGRSYLKSYLLIRTRPGL